MGKLFSPSDRANQDEENNVLHQYVQSPRLKDKAIFKSQKNADSAKILIFKRPISLDPGDLTQAPNNLIILHSTGNTLENGNSRNML